MRVGLVLFLDLLIWGYNPVQDDRSDFTQSRPLYGDICPHVLRTPVQVTPVILHGVVSPELTLEALDAGVLATLLHKRSSQRSASCLCGN